LANLGKDATANFRQSHGESAHGVLAKLFIADLGKVSSGPMLSIQKADSSLARWPMLGSLAKLQGLQTTTSLIAGQECRQTTLTSVFTMGDTTTFNSNAERDEAPGSMPPSGHGGGSMDVAACPFMALANPGLLQDLQERNSKSSHASTQGQPPFNTHSTSAAAGAPEDVAGIMSPTGSRGRAFIPLMRNSDAAHGSDAHSADGSQRASLGGVYRDDGRSETGSKLSDRSRVSGSKRSAGTKSSDKSHYASLSESQGGSKGASSSAIGSGGMFRDHRQKRRGGVKKATTNRTPEVQP
jgi:hypothetical protein